MFQRLETLAQVRNTPCCGTHVAVQLNYGSQLEKLAMYGGLLWKSGFGSMTYRL